MPSPSTKQIFSHVYATKKWGSEGGGSGVGSSLVESMGASRVLFHVILSLNVHVVVDAACGAMTWQRRLLPQLFSARPNLRYIGLDAAESVVRSNQRTFRNESRVRFEHVELEKSAIPPTDLIFSRDTMQHNSIEGVNNILQRFAESNASHVLVTSFPNGSHYCRGAINRPISTGDFFCVDLARKPFELEPVARFEEISIDKKWLYLYERKQLHKPRTKDGI